MDTCKKTSVVVLNWLFIFSFILKSSSATTKPVIDNETPDFIIVGGGTSGCVVAGRLSEKFSVLLLEAGDYPGDILDIPATAFSKINEVPGILKVYKSVSKKNPASRSDLTSNGTYSYIIGTTLGGGSSINGMIYNRGSPYDYDNWANVTNDSGWKYKNLIKYFKRIEDYQGGFSSETSHGKDGPITISRSNYAPGLESWLEAGKSFGFMSNADPNGPQVPSFTPVEFSRRRGRRVSAFTGYLKPYLSNKPNLKIVTQAEVKRIIFNAAKTQAIGVMYSLKNKEGRTISVYANKEVIISAGTMDSPAIMMRSGIGPEDVLKNSNIPPVKILPVGHNLQDHLILKVEFLLDRNASHDVFIAKRDLNVDTWKNYEETGDGPFATFGLAAQAFLVSSVRKQEPYPNSKWPDIQLVQVHSVEKLNVIPEVDKENRDNELSVYVMPTLGRPKSRGRVTLNQEDIDGHPIIDFNFFSDPEDHDMLTLIEAVKITIKLYEEAPLFQNMGARLSNVPYKPCSHLVFKSDEYWRCFIRQMVGCGLHGGGTCKMGRGKDDKSAVVDSALKVIGIGGLRVVDLSIMPNVTNANSQAAAYLIAEKGSDMIVNDWVSGKDEL